MAKRKLKLPANMPEMPELLTGHECTSLEARALIEEVAQREHGIDWYTFRKRWNHSDRSVVTRDADGKPVYGFTDAERDYLRPIARLLPHAARGLRGFS